MRDDQPRRDILERGSGAKALNVQQRENQQRQPSDQQAQRLKAEGNVNLVSEMCDISCEPDDCDAEDDAQDLGRQAPVRRRMLVGA